MTDRKASDVGHDASAVMKKTGSNKSAKRNRSTIKGRPSKFMEIEKHQVEKLAKAGWTDAQMADFFEVTEQTWNNWKSAHPDFFESLKSWKVEADHKVERALFERATGYSHPDVHISTQQGEVTVTPITKHYAPDTTAAIFWLKNRNPSEWREKSELKHSRDPLDQLLDLIDGKTRGLPQDHKQ